MLSEALGHPYVIVLKECRIGRERSICTQALIASLTLSAAFSKSDATADTGRCEQSRDSGERGHLVNPAVLIAAIHEPGNGAPSGVALWSFETQK
jgi:hypothetical protein